MATVREAGSHCAAEIREAESYSAAQACSIQQSHLEGMQSLKTDALEEEGRDHLSFLSACGAALQACPPNVLGILMYPLHLLTGNMSLATLLSLLHQVYTNREESTLMSTPAAPAPSPGAKWPHLPNVMSSSPLLGDATGNNNGPPCLKWKGETSYMMSLKGDWQEAFAKDSHLVQWAREDYFKAHHPHFNHETLWDLSDLLQDMIISADLLDSKISKSKRTGPGKKTYGLQMIHWRLYQRACIFSKLYCQQNCPKSCPLPFCQYASYPWCRKEGQNEGTIVNHLWTTHYRLGLAC